MSENRGRGHGRGGARSGSRFGSAILQMVLDEIAARLQRIGVVGGTAIDAGHLVGAAPAGVSRTTIRLNGVELCAVGEIEFTGPAWAITCDPARPRVYVALANGGLEPRDLVARSTGEEITDRASTPHETVITRPTP